jgi:hypothetical protein
MRWKMRNKLMVIPAFSVLLTACVSSVMAEAWLDKMESYTEATMKSPWTTTGTAPMVAPYSYDGSMVALSKEVSTGRDAWRQIVGGAGTSGSGYACARVKVGGAGSCLCFGVFGDRIAKDGMPSSESAACFQVYGTSDGAKPQAVFAQNGSIGYAAYVELAPWASDSWHDIAVAWTPDHMTLTWSWKLPTETTWKQLAYTAASPVSIHFVGVGLKCYSAIDDVGFNMVPEPISETQSQLGAYPIPRENYPVDLEILRKL